MIFKSPVRRRHKPALQREEKLAWTPEQIRLIIEKAPERYRTFFLCLVVTGIRVGEILALKWKNLDFEKRTIKIECNLWQKELVTPKTKGSKRLIHFGEILATHLNSHLGNSTHIGGDDFVFAKEDGSPLHPDVMRKDVLYPILDSLHIERKSRATGFHAFRHSAGSILNDQTGNLKLVQKLLGHANVSTTADIYTHIYNETERATAGVIESAIFGAGEGKN